MMMMRFAMACWISLFLASVFALAGMVVCYLWARDLSNRLGGICAVTLWAFQPQVLSHGSLITNDVSRRSDDGRISLFIHQMDSGPDNYPCHWLGSGLWNRFDLQVHSVIAGPALRNVDPDHHSPQSMESDPLPVQRVPRDLLADCQPIIVEPEE